MVRHSRLFQPSTRRQFRRAPSTVIPSLPFPRPETASPICQKSPNHSMAMLATLTTRRRCPAPSPPPHPPTTSRVLSPLSANQIAPTAVSPLPSSSPPPTPPPTPLPHPVYHLPPTPPVNLHPPLPHPIRPALPGPRHRNRAAHAPAPLSLVPHPRCFFRNHSAVPSPIATRVTSRQMGSSTT